MLKREIILGGKGFKTKISELLDKIEANEKLPQIERLREDVGIDKVMRACCSFYGKAQEDLLKRGEGKSKKRWLIYLSKTFSGRKNTEVGRYSGIKGPVVSGAIKAVEM